MFSERLARDAPSTQRYIDAELMTQVRPYGHIDIRQDFQVLTYQAIVE